MTEFVRRQPRATPVLFEYGDGFADFLAGCAVLSSYPYLADVARLERLRTRAFHAADGHPLDLGNLARLNPERMAQAPIGLHPSVGVLDSRHPVVDLWKAQTDESAMLPRQWMAQCALIWRQEWRVQVQPVGPSLARFLRRLSDGRSFAQALATLSREPDAEQLLAQLLNDGVLAAVATTSVISIHPEESKMSTPTTVFPMTPPTSGLGRLRQLVGRIPDDLLLLLERIFPAAVF